MLGWFPYYCWCWLYGFLRETDEEYLYCFLYIDASGLHGMTPAARLTTFFINYIEIRSGVADWFMLSVGFNLCMCMDSNVDKSKLSMVELIALKFNFDMGWFVFSEWSLGRECTTVDNGRPVLLQTPRCWSIRVFKFLWLLPFRALLSLACKNTHFLFNKVLYKQIDGVSMGSPLGPTLANFFLTFNEKKWISECPIAFKPLFYKRYVDDTFVIFSNSDHATHFLNYINAQHRNISFTMERQKDKCLNFLDTCITITDRSVSSTIYRKDTFSGLGINFFSFTSLKFKINSIKTLLYRAYTLSSSYSIFCNELSFLRTFFSNNGYLMHIIESNIRNFLNNKFIPKPLIITVPKKTIYFSLPYYSSQSEVMANKLRQSLEQIYPQLKLHFSLTNNFTVKSYFSYKDKLPCDLLSNTIYEYKCGDCPASYIGSSHRNLKSRID